MWREGGLFNAEINNANTKRPMKNVWTAHLAWNVLEEQTRGWKTKADLMSQSGCALATSEGLGIPSDYWLLPTLKSCFTTLINNLSVKHTIGQQMILFHRFLDLTDELFIGVLPLVQDKRGRGCWKGKDKESSKFIIHKPVYMNGLSLKGFFFFFSPTYISPALSTSAEWELPGADKSCNLPDLPSMSGTVVFLYPSKCYWVCKLWKIGINLDPVQHLWFFIFLRVSLNYAGFSATHSWPRCSG